MTSPIDLQSWLLRTALEGSLLLAAVIALRAALGARLSPGWRVGLWALVMLKLLIPACVPAGFGLGAIWEGRAETAADSAVAAAVDRKMEEAAPAAHGTAAAADLEKTGHVTAKTAFVSLWLAGALTVLGVSFARQRQFELRLADLPAADDPDLAAMLRRLAGQAGVPLPQVLLGAPGGTPALLGIRRPRILLPADWRRRFDDRSLRHVLLHELLHIRHHDLLWNWAALTVQALHWFNPLVWAAASRFQADRELRCDAGAVALLAPGERIDYGRTLLRFQQAFSAPPAIAGLAPWVRNHPALRERILMIATPASRHPALQAALALTLSLLAGWSFTTARAAEKEVPPKIRQGEAARQPTDPTDPANPRKKAERSRDGEGAPKPGMKDGERPRSGERDGDKPRNGPRDGEAPRRPGMKDGERPRTGERDGDKPRTGPRDGEAPRKPGMKDGERPRTAEREGDKARPADSASVEVITLKVTAGGQTVLVGSEKVPMNRLRAHLSTFLPQHPSARVIVTGDGDIPLRTLQNTVDAVRDNGGRDVAISAD